MPGVGFIRPAGGGGGAAVENSDGSYSTTVESGGTLVVPNTPISANGDLIINQPSTIAKDVVVRYETEGIVPTNIVGGEVVVPDSGIIPGRRPMQIFGASRTNWLYLDDFGNFTTINQNGISAWDEPTTGVVSIDFESSNVMASNLQWYIGFVETATVTVNDTFTGFIIFQSSINFYENNIFVATIADRVVDGDAVYKCTRGADGKVRAYRDGTILYTSAITQNESINPKVLNVYAKSYITSLHVTY